MDIDHLFLGFYNNTSLNGMAQLLDESIKRGYKSKIVIRRNQTYALSNIDKKNIVYINYSFIKLIALLNVLQLDLLIFFISKVFRKGKNNFIFDFRKFLWKKLFKTLFKFQKSMLSRYKPKVIYTFGDRTNNILEPGFLKLAKTLGIPTVIPPFVSFANYEELLSKYRTEELRKIHNFSEKNVTNFLYFRKKFKKQCAYHALTDSYISFYEPWQTEAMFEEGVLSNNPWVVGSGQSSFLCLQGEIEYQKYLKNKISPKKMIITGNPENDKLHESFIRKENIKKDFFRKHKISKNKKLLFIALPQYKEHSLASDKIHWEIINSICESISSLDCQSFLSLHPKTKRSEYSFLEKKYSLTILDQKLSEILPICDIFLGGMPTSTAYWPILCEVPLILINPFKLNHEKKYEGIQGIEFVDDISKIDEAVRKIINDDLEIDRIKELFKSQKSKISTFEGNNTSKLLNPSIFAS